MNVRIQTNHGRDYRRSGILFTKEKQVFEVGKDLSKEALANACNAAGYVDGLPAGFPSGRKGGVLSIEVTKDAPMRTQASLADAALVAKGEAEREAKRA